MQRPSRLLATLAILIILVACGSPGTINRALVPATPIATAAFSADGTLLATANADRSITIWDVATGTARQTLGGQGAAAVSIAFSADRALLAVGGEDHRIGLWDVATGKAIRTLSGHTDVVNSVAFSPDSQTLASGGQDGTVRLWDVASGNQRQSLSAGAGVTSVAYSPDGRSLASGGRNATVQLWDTGSNRLTRSYTGHKDAIGALAFSPDSQSLASGSADREVKIWSVQSDQAGRSLIGHGGGISALSFAPDGTSLASGSDDRTVKLWDTASGQTRRTLTGHSAAVPAVAYSPDGKSVLTGSRDSSARQWDAATGQLQRSIRIAAAPVATPVTATTGSIVPGLSGVTVTIGQPNQQADLTFTGKANRRVSVAIQNLTLREADLLLAGPDGTVLRQLYLFQTTAFLDATLLPGDGTYTLTLKGRNGATGTATLTAYEFDDTTGTIAPGGPGVAVSVATPGQNAQLTFAGRAGQRVSALVGTLTAREADLRLVGPDGVTAASLYMFQPEQFFDAQLLPADGTYTLIFDPRNGELGGATITAYDVRERTGTIEPGGAPVPVATDTPGQNVPLTFQGRAGQQISVAITDMALEEADLVLRGPDGGSLAARYMFQAESFFDTVRLPADGTYTLTFDPRGNLTGSATLWAYDVVDRQGQIAVGGAPVPVSTDTPGQTARLTFTGRAGQTVAATIDQLALEDGDLQILGPDGTIIRTTYFFQDGQTLEATLPTSGTYTLVFDPRDAKTGGARLTLK